MARTRKPGLIFLDTHIVCWLYEGRVDLLSKPAADAIETGQLNISPMVSLELDYLHEIGRIKLDSGLVIKTLTEEIGLQIADAPFQRIIGHANKLDWTRDPFDRIIVAHAIQAQSPLVTRDRAIREHFNGAVW
jgi:PIN domain nuclease of toxin-antitoxin system